MNQIVEKIMDTMSGNFDITKKEDDCFEAECHMVSEKFFGSKAINIWTLEDHCYAYVYHIVFLDAEILEKTLNDSLEKGLSKVSPGPEHRCSSVLTLIVCENINPEIKQKIKKYRFMKNYKLSLRGWSEHAVVAMILSEKEIISNRDGKATAKTLEKINFE